MPFGTIRDVAAQGDTLRALYAGAAASAAYAAEMYLDMAITQSAFDDLQLIEGVVRGRRARIPALGMLIHIANGAALGVAYAELQRFFPGPPWLKGLLFGTGFLLVAWPGAPVVDRVHPLIQRGELPKLNRPVVFGQNVARHVVYGLVLGWVYGPR
jgi:hypothetical protein